MRASGWEAEPRPQGLHPVGRFADSEQSSFSVTGGVERCSVGGGGASQWTRKVTEAAISMALAIETRTVLSRT